MCFELSDEGINWLDDRGNDLNESQLCRVIASNICKMRCYDLIVFEVKFFIPGGEIGIMLCQKGGRGVKRRMPMLRMLKR